MEKQNKDKIIGVRFSEEEYAKVEAACKKAELPLATYIRSVVLRDLQQSAPPGSPAGNAALRGTITEFLEELSKALPIMIEKANKKK